MAKVAIKSENLSPFGGIFSMEQFDSNLSSVIDSTPGMRCRLYGYQYSEIIRSLMSVDFCGSSCIEDVTTHLMYHLSLHPTLRTCSADTILRAINCFGTRNTRNVQKLMRHLTRQLMGYVIYREIKILQTLHKTLHFLCISLISRTLHCVWFEAKILHKPCTEPYMGTKRLRD